MSLQTVRHATDRENADALAAKATMAVKGRLAAGLAPNTRARAALGNIGNLAKKTGVPVAKVSRLGVVGVVLGAEVFEHVW